VLAAGLACYTVALLLYEWRTSQDAVRRFFTDIGEGRPLYGINTTICVALLGGASILFAVLALGCGEEPEDRAERRFALSQTIVFFYLACDDRLQLHELIGLRLPFEDAWVVAGVGLIEVLLVWRLGRFPARPAAQRRYLALGAVLFAAMTVVDVVGPSAMPLRLSVEDLLKTWACAALALFAWECCRHRIVALRTAAQTPAAFRM
jgi:hypothetical protein